MHRRRFLRTATSIVAAGAAGGTVEVLGQVAARTSVPTVSKFDIHSHYYTRSFFQKINDSGDWRETPVLEKQEGSLGIDLQLFADQTSDKSIQRLAGTGKLERVVRPVQFETAG